MDVGPPCERTGKSSLKAKSFDSPSQTGGGWEMGMLCTALTCAALHKLNQFRAAESQSGPEEKKFTPRQGLSVGARCARGHCRGLWCLHFLPSFPPAPTSHSFGPTFFFSLPPVLLHHIFARLPLPPVPPLHNSSRYFFLLPPPSLPFLPTKLPPDDLHHL